MQTLSKDSQDVVERNGVEISDLHNSISIVKVIQNYISGTLRLSTNIVSRLWPSWSSRLDYAPSTKHQLGKRTDMLN